MKEVTLFPAWATPAIEYLILSFYCIILDVQMRKVCVMKINKIQNNNSFRGKLINTPALEEFKSSLNERQNKIFKKNIIRMERQNDGRVFKFDKTQDGRVGIFEKFNRSFVKPWIAIVSSPKEHSAWCFDELRKMYDAIIGEKFNKHIENLEVKK